MRYTTRFAALAALISLAAADDAPTAEGTNIGQTFAATLPNNGNGNVTGSIVGAGAPDGQGSNFQIALYNLPEGGSLTYGISANKLQGSDCNSGGGLLNPFNGVQGADCTENNQAECAIGDLSGKHGNVVLETGGAGTGYFTLNVVDPYLSTEKGSDAFFGNKAIIIMDQNSTPLTCANFVNQAKLSTDAENAKQNETDSSSSGNGGSGTTTSSSGTQASESASPSESGNAGARTAAVSFGAAAGVIAALFL